MKKQETVYEWSVEEIEDGDVLDTWFFDSLAPCMDYYNSFLDNNRALCLVRSTGSDIAGEIGRLYAYVAGGKLPEYFEGSDIRVPARYHSELQQTTLI